MQDEDGSSAVQAKRQRLTPPREVAHISDAIKDPQPQVEELKSALKKARQEAAEEAKARLKAEESTAYFRDRLKEITQSLGEVQLRYETRVKQVHELRIEKQRIQTEREADQRRQEQLLADNIALKDQRFQFQEELRAARETLKSSTTPGVAELEAAREAARKATEESVRLTTSMDNSRRDFEFTRSQYQDASSKAAEYASQVSELENKNADLKRQANDERRRLAEMNYRENRKRDMARIGELEAELKNLEVSLQRAEEENKALRKGRAGVTTRGSSVQPGVLGGGGSRAASPAPGVGAGCGGSTVHVHAGVGGRASTLRNER